VNRVCAIVVTHHPDARVGERVAGIASQVDVVLVVDNGSPAESRARLRALEQAGRIRLIENAENQGVATALNQGARWASAQGFPWVLLLDQDTEADPDLVRALLQIYERHPRAGEVGVVGALPHPRPGVGRRLPRADGAWRRAGIVITSGSLLRLATIERVGPFRDEFFVDHVDDDYCLRIAARGMCVLQSTRPLMRHSIGTPSSVRLPWKRSQTSNHSALRRYFMTRNHVVLIREHWRTRPGWVLRTLRSRLKSTLLMVLFEPERGPKLRAIGLGLVDGLSGRLGPQRIAGRSPGEARSGRV
jgi:rhamnosyltransferase